MGMAGLKGFAPLLSFAPVLLTGSVICNFISIATHSAFVSPELLLDFKVKMVLVFHCHILI